MSFQFSNQTNAFTCNEEKIQELLSFGAASLGSLPFNPHKYFFFNSDGHTCFVNWTNELITPYCLLYGVEDTDSYTIKQYDAYMVLTEDKFDPPNTGYNLVTYNSSSTILDKFPYTGKNRNCNYIQFLSDNDVTITNYAQFNYSNTGVITMGFTTSIIDLYRYATTEIIQDPCRYIFFNDQEQVLFDSIEGVMNTSFNTWKSATFPFLNETSLEFWHNILQNESLPFNYTFYTLATRPIDVGEGVTYKLVMACMPGHQSKSVMYFTSVILVILLVSFLICVIVALCFIQHINNRLQAQISRRVYPKSNTVEEPDIAGGACLAALHRLRRLELALPDDRLLNKAVDTAINHLAMPRDAHLLGDASCPLCSAINGSVSFGGVDTERAFPAWRRVTLPRLIQVGPLSDQLLEVGKLPNSPARVVALVAAVLDRKNLLVMDADPDSIISFVVLYVRELCSKPILAELQLAGLCHILSLPFSQWIGSPLNHLAILFCSLLFSSDEEAIQKKADEILKSDKDNEDKMKSDSISEAFNRFSFYKNIRIIIQNCIPGLRGGTEFADSFFRLVFLIHSCASDYSVFKIIGTFRIRSESASFSPMESPSDYQIFICFLGILAKYTPYWSPNNIMARVSGALDHLAQFPRGTSRNTKNEYHLMVAQCIAKPSIDVLSKITNVKQVQQYVEENIDYWDKRTEDSPESSLISFT